MFESPFTLILSGATGSGKTRWLLKFLDHAKDIIEPPPKSILYCYGEINAAVLSLQNRGVEIYHGIPDENLIKSKEKPLLLLLDDLLLDMRSDFLNRLFTRGSHNWNVSVVLVVQSLFSKNTVIPRTNSHYHVLMKNPAGMLQIRTLGTQLFPKSLNYFIEAYQDATREPFSYIVINMHPNAPETLRLSSKIFPGEKTEIYLPITH